MGEEVTKAAGKMIESATSMYRSRSERVAMRSGIGDAAGLCDAIAKQIMEEHRGRGGTGPTRKHGRELAAIAKRCGDEIWAMREMVKLDD